MEKDINEVIEDLQHWARNMFISTERGDLADIIKDMQQIKLSLDSEVFRCLNSDCLRYKGGLCMAIAKKCTDRQN